MLKNSLFYSCFWISLQIHNWELPSSVWEGICLQKTERHSEKNTCFGLPESGVFSEHKIKIFNTQDCSKFMKNCKQGCPDRAPW